MNIVYAITKNHPIGRRIECYNFTPNTPRGADLVTILYEEAISLDSPDNYQEFNNPLTDESWKVTGYSIELDAEQISVVIFKLQRNLIN